MSPYPNFRDQIQESSDGDVRDPKVGSDGDVHRAQVLASPLCDIGGLVACDRVDDVGDLDTVAGITSTKKKKKKKNREDTHHQVDSRPFSKFIMQASAAPFYPSCANIEPTFSMRDDGPVIFSNNLESLRGNLNFDSSLPIDSEDGDNSDSMGIYSDCEPWMNTKSKKGSFGMEMSKPKGIVMIQGKNTPNVKPQHWHCTNISRVPQIGLDEFKYGFPSDGLAVVSHNWWESSSEDTNNNVSVDGGEKSHERELKSGEVMDHGDDADEKGLDAGNIESNVDLRGTGLLSHLRKRAAEEGKEALRLGVYRGFDVSKVGMKERKLLFRVFKSSIPSNRKTGPFDS